MRRTNKSPSSPIHLTDAQRAEIDTQTSTLLHDLSSNISSLTAAENLRISTETALLERRFGKPNKKGLLWRWAAGSDDANDDEGGRKSAEQVEVEGRAHGIRVCREGILWYLGWSLQGVVGVQRGMIEVRAAREREKEKSVLWKMKGGEVGSSGGGGGQSHRAVAGGQIPRRTADSSALGEATNNDPDYRTTSTFNPSLSEPPAESPDDEDSESLPPSLRQLLATENSTLLTHYSTSLTKIVQAERSLLEISALQSTLVSHLATQGELIEQLVSDAQGTGENVQRGNRELKRAGERWGRGMARGVFWGSVGICGGLVLWDLVF